MTNAKEILTVAERRAHFYLADSVEQRRGGILKNLAVKNQSATARENQPTKWSLTATAFDKLLLCLDKNREKSGEKYLLLRRNLVRFFEGRRCAEADETADEVFNRLARKLDAEEQIENINQYAYGVARMLVLELYKKQTRRQKMLSEIEPKNEIFPTKMDETELRLECLHSCLNDLPAESRELILAYYQGDGREKIENRQRLAEKLGIPNNALRNRAVRLRDKLKILVSRNFKKQTI